MAFLFSKLIGKMLYKLSNGVIFYYYELIESLENSTSLGCIPLVFYDFNLLPYRNRLI